MTGILIDLTPYVFKGFEFQLFKRRKDTINHKSKNKVHHVNDDIAFIRFCLFRILMTLLVIFVYITAE